MDVKGSYVPDIKGHCGIRSSVIKLPDTVLDIKGHYGIGY